MSYIGPTIAKSVTYLIILDFIEKLQDKHSVLLRYNE